MNYGTGEKAERRVERGEKRTEEGKGKKKKIKEEEECVKSKYGKQGNEMSKQKEKTE